MTAQLGGPAATVCLQHRLQGVRQPGGTLACASPGTAEGSYGLGIGLWAERWGAVSPPIEIEVGNF